MIATDREIDDQAARVFAGLFYTSLATGADIAQAFREAEKGLQVQFEEAWRGIKFRGDEKAGPLPWKIYPKRPHSWRLPQVAKHLTRIPAIDLDKEFLGRETDMQRLKEKLENTSKVVLMNGLGGIGKTVLATAYVQQCSDYYAHLSRPWAV